MMSYGGMFPEHYVETYLPTRNNYSNMIYKFCIFLFYFLIYSLLMFFIKKLKMLSK